MAEQKRTFTLDELFGEPEVAPGKRTFTPKDLFGVSTKVCPDGTVVNENEECPEQGERGILANLSRSLVGAGRGLADIPDAIDLQFDTFRVNQLPKKLDIYKAIDEGADPRELYREANKEAKVFGPVELGDFVTYQEADAEKRARLKGNVETTVTESRADILETLPELERRQQETAQKYGPRVEGITDIRSLGDFRDWLTYSIGSGVVQLAPVMASAMIAGPVGAVTAGTALAGSETVNNRLDFIRGITKELSPEDQAQAISDYLNATKDTSTITALVSGALDMAGPVGGILKRKLAKEVGQELTESIPKQFAKEMGEEGLTGGAQEITQIAGQRSLGEQEGDVFSTENIKRVIDAAAAEAAGSIGGTSFNVGVDVATGRRQARQEVDAKIKQQAKLAVDTSKRLLGTPEAQQKLRIRTQQLVQNNKNMDEGTAIKIAAEEVLEAELAKEETGVTTLDSNQQTQVTAIAEKAIEEGADEAGLDSYKSYIVLQEAGLGGNDAGVFLQQEIDRLGGLKSVEIVEQDQQEPEIGGGIEVEDADPQFGELQEDLSLDKQIATFISENNGATISEIQNEFKIGFNPAQDAVNKIPNIKQNPETLSYNVEVILKPPGRRGRPTQPPRTPEEQARVDQNKKDQKNRSRSAARINTRLNKILNANPQQIIELGIKRSKKQTGINTYQEYNELKNRVAELREIRDAGMFTDPERGERAIELNKEFNEKQTTLTAIQDATAVEQTNYKDNRIDALADAYEIVNNPAYQGNKKALASAQEFIDGDAFTDLEKKDAKAARIKKKAALQKPAQSIPISEYVEEEVNPVLTDPNVTLESALDSVVKGGKKFESFVARRLRPFIKDTKLQIIPTDLGAVDPQIAGEFVTGAAGVYFDDTNTIFLSSRNDGLNNLTLLHEAVHAATMNLLARSINDPSSVPERVNRLRQEILDQMDEAAMKYAVDKANGRTTPEMDKLAEELDIFTDLMEFVAYGITQPEFQEFLISVQPTIGYIQDIQKNGLSGLVNVVRRLFGFGDNTLNGFITLLDTTDQLLRAGRPTKRVPTSTIAAAKKVANKIKGTARKVDRSRTYNQQMKGIGNLVKNRDPKLAANIINATAEAVGERTRKLLVKAFTTEGITRTLVNNFEIESATRVNDVVMEMSATRARRIRELVDKVPVWENFNGTFVDGADLLADIMHMATIDSFDPSKYKNVQDALQNDPDLKDRINKYQSQRTSNVTVGVVNQSKGEVTQRENKIKEIFDMWSRLQDAENGGQRGVKIYNMAKDAYEKTFDEHQELLVAKIEQAEMDSEEEKKELLARIVSNYQRAKKMEVYFPLMRYGQYFIRAKEGGEVMYFMYESDIDRKLQLKELQADPNIEVSDAGDTTLQEFEQEFKSSSKMLSDIYGLIEKKGLSNEDDIKDQIYQMYLMTLPEADIRRKFTRRKARAGFSSDVLRNFIVSQNTAANQLARLEHTDDLRAAIAGVEAATAGMPVELKSKVAPYTAVLRSRALQETAPPDRTDFLDRAASLGNSAVFYYMLSSPKSALIQFTQLPIVGIPVLSAEFGGVATSKIIAKYTKNIVALQGFGSKEFIEDESGELIPQYKEINMAKSNYVMENSDPEMREALLKAHEYAVGREIFMSTYASDMTSRSRTPSDEFGRPGNKIQRMAIKTLSGAFHHAERLNREIMYMSSFELAYAEAKNRGLSTEEAQEEAQRRAVELTYKGLFNYTNYNKPDLMKGPIGRIATQFMTFPLQMSSILFRNFARGVFGYKGMGMSNTDRMEALGTFAGMLGMTWLFAGTVGMPLFSVFASGIDLIKNELFGDDEEEERDYDLLSFKNVPTEVWIRSVFIPKMFGPDGDISNALGLSEEQAALFAKSIEMGPLSAITDANIGASTSLDGLWFRNDLPKGDFENAWINFAYNTFTGPFGSMASSAFKAGQDFRDEEYQRGLETMSPAMFRGPLKAYRLSQEGLVNRQGVELKPPEYYSEAMLIAQGLGFTSTETASMQDINYQIANIIRDQETKKTEALDRLDRALLNQDRNPDGVVKAMADITKYNVKYFYDQIDYDTIERSLTGKAERRGEALEGVYVREKVRAVVAPLIEPKLQNN